MLHRSVLYQLRRLKGDMYTDMAIGKVKLLNGNKYAQVFADTNNFVAVYPMRSKTMAGDALAEFTQDFGVPTRIYSDGSKEQTEQGTTFVKTAKMLHIELRKTGLQQPEQNRAEGSICELKKQWFRTMTQKSVPKRLWDFCLVWYGVPKSCSVPLTPSMAYMVEPLLRRSQVKRQT
jgi:hypothetical protein